MVNSNSLPDRPSLRGSLARGGALFGSDWSSLADAITTFGISLFCMWTLRVRPSNQGLITLVPRKQRRKVVASTHHRFGKPEPIKWCRVHLDRSVWGGRFS